MSLRLDTRLLFYGLDDGTWSDPPKIAPWPGDGSLLRPTCGGAPAGSSEAKATWWPPAPAAAAGQAPALDPLGPIGRGMGGCAYRKALAEAETGAATSRAAVPPPKDPPAPSAPPGAELGPAAVAATRAARSSVPHRAAETSTDEGSEAKGSESSESVPESGDYNAATPSMGLPPGLSSRLLTPSAILPQMDLSMAAAANAGYVSLELEAVAANANVGYGSVDLEALFAMQGTRVDMEAMYPPQSAVHIDLSLGGLQVPQPAVAPSGIPSIGSWAHLSGSCSRCCFHPKGRCTNGYACRFCHLDHDKRPRNGKKKRGGRQGGQDNGLDNGSDDDNFQ